ncbi:Uncharacterised protein [Legionella beliardensis]|uniref:Uncharacterized protein n=1 Tax=Legionella beliardensis TaxID=91822 RepID=A0A378I0U5_9GAMM|nr:hypothetical protein [Legionella beliardensis]STX28603.1 Uncharacterised protein [Legionella beliardensis]
MIAMLLRNYMRLKFVQVVLKLLKGKKGTLLKGGFPIALATFVLEEVFNRAWKDKSKNKATNKPKK